MGEKNEQVAQNIIMESRGKLSISGVEDVDSFDENQTIIYTAMGLLEVKGTDIHMSRLNLESGEIILEGNFDSTSYIETEPKSNSNKQKGFFSRLFASEK